MSKDALDVLVFTALVEEARVVDAVMRAEASHVHGTNDLEIFDYTLNSNGRTKRIAIASAYEQGATSMAAFAGRLLSQLKPHEAVLVGIAAFVDGEVLRLGDVPFAEQVVSYDDIAIEDATMTFRSRGKHAAIDGYPQARRRCLRRDPGPRRHDAPLRVHDLRSITARVATFDGITGSSRVGSARLRMEATFGSPHGAIRIPVLDEVARIVYRVADGEQVEFPIVLDER